MKYKLDGKILTKFVGLRRKACSYYADDSSEDKKANRTKKHAIKRKIRFGIYKNCLEATQLDNKINYLEKKMKLAQVVLKKVHEEFIKHDNLLLKTQQRFKSETYNIFTEEINKIVLSSNDDKKMQSIDLIETCTYGMSNDLVRDKRRD